MLQQYCIITSIVTQFLKLKWYKIKVYHTEHHYMKILEEPLNHIKNIQQYLKDELHSQDAYT